MAKRKASGRVYSPKQLQTALNHLKVDWANVDKASKTRKKSRYKLNTKKTATPHQTMGRKNDSLLSYIQFNKSGFTQIDRTFELFAKDLTTNLHGKAYTWAVETKNMMKEVSPILTGNLRDSVKILRGAKAEGAISEKLEVEDKKGEIVYVVGIDEKAILPPPFRKHIIRGPNKGKMRTMPKFNYANKANTAILALKSEGYQGYAFLEKWQVIAEKNMERIFR